MNTRLNRIDIFDGASLRSSRGNEAFDIFDF
jgi:hypothetical protein